MRSGWRAALSIGVVMVQVLVPASPAALAETPRKFALAVFHFNIQYVAGGLLGFLPGDASLGAWELDEEALEDQIVRESFEPVLDLFLAHPSWGADIELQGLFLDVLGARHPGVLEKLRKLATSGQIAVLSFHYSDQLFLAFPSEEWRRSQALTAATFEQHGIPLSTSVFCQEGQAGVGMADAMADRGYGLMVWPTNLWKYQHGDDPVAPLYRFGNRDDVAMIVGGRDVHQTRLDGSIDTVWTFLDDGELLATGGIDPYFPPVFVHQPAAVAKYESELEALESQGFSVTTTAKYVAALADLGVDPEEPPPLMDGTWQPQSTDGIHRWLGGVGLWGGAERDNSVRTIQAIAHRELMAAETVAGTEGENAGTRAALDGAWRLLALAEVSDASGINPFRGEIEYGIAHATEALRISRAVIHDAKRVLRRDVLAIDTRTGQVGLTADSAEPNVTTPALDLIVEAPGREKSETWTQQSPGVTRVTITFSPMTEGSDRSVTVAFPGHGDDIVYSPGLAEDRVLTVPRSTFVWDHFHLALPNGLLGLGGDRFVIKDQAAVHVAAKLWRDRGEVSFSDQTLPAEQGATWSFLLVEGNASAALAEADRLNVHPLLVR